MACGYNCEYSCEECDVPDKVIEFVNGYNQALEDFSKKMKEVNLTNSFVLYCGDEIDLEEFMNLASDEILEQLKK